MSCPSDYCSGSTGCQLGGLLALMIYRMTFMTGSGPDHLGEWNNTPAKKTAFYDGFYKAFGFGIYPCIYCGLQHCAAEETPKVVDESMRRKCRPMDTVCRA